MTELEPLIAFHLNSDAAKRIVEGEREEIRLYWKYRDYLSYGFYIARKLSGE